jgi:hypothetical protein
MDNDFCIDIGDIVSTLRTSDVAAMRFVVVGERLILDFRATEIDGPMVKLVPPVNSMEERYRALQRLRPRFPAPNKIAAIWWPRFAESLRATGIWDVVLERVSASGHPEAVRQAAQALDELMRLELARQREAIAGDGFRTLWSASPSRL